MRAYQVNNLVHYLLCIDQFLCKRKPCDTNEKKMLIQYKYLCRKTFISERKHSLNVAKNAKKTFKLKLPHTFHWIVTTQVIWSEASSWTTMTKTFTFMYIFSTTKRITGHRAFFLRQLIFVLFITTYINRFALKLNVQLSLFYEHLFKFQFIKNETWALHWNLF